LVFVERSSKNETQKMVKREEIESEEGKTLVVYALQRLVEDDQKISCTANDGIHPRRGNGEESYSSTKGCQPP